MKAGPNPASGCQPRRPRLYGSYWLSKRWAVEGPAAAISEPAAPLRRKTLDIGARSSWSTSSPAALSGSVRTTSTAPSSPTPCSAESTATSNRTCADSALLIGFYNSQLASAAIIGGHMDLNRSARWVFRITPDANITHYGIDYGDKATQSDVNFAISVGVEYKFKQKRFYAHAEHQVSIAAECLRPASVPAFSCRRLRLNKVRLIVRVVFSPAFRRLNAHRERLTAFSGTFRFGALGSPKHQRKEAGWPRT